VPGRRLSRPRGTSAFTPTSETGTTGAPASIARRKLPRLKCPTAPSWLRVPSGNTRTLSPARIRSAAESRLRRARNGFERSIGMWPPRAMVQPMNGTSESDFL
jgi:hypothetical protein